VDPKVGVNPNNAVWCFQVSAWMIALPIGVFQGRLGLRGVAME
jgi:hypothetical protein